MLVIGAGNMGRGLAATLKSRGVGRLSIANRTHERAEELAAELGGEAVPLTDVADVLVDADVLFTSTASSEILLERATVEMVVACRAGRRLLILDVALPRDVDPGVREVNDVTLLDLDDLKDYAQRSASRRRAEIGKVREILSSEIERYRGERAAREVSPLVTALAFARRGRPRAASSIDSGPSWPGSTPSTRELVDALTQGIVNKLLHEPTVRVKEAAGTPRGDYYADALGALFDLPVAE